MTADSLTWAQWRHSLVHAQPAYWSVQTLAVILMMVVATLIWLPSLPEYASAPATAMHLGRALFNTLLTIGVAHAAIRPVLKFGFINRPRDLRAVLKLAGWIVLLAVLATPVSQLASRLLLPVADVARQLDLTTGAGRTAVDLSTLNMTVLTFANMLFAFALWTLLYLGFTALQLRTQLQQQLREARLRQLTNQLNPHFLFNAFNTIRGMIFEDRERAAELLTQLSELFRFHLDHEVCNEQTLEEELQLAKRYLDMELVRLESRLRLTIDIQNECLVQPLPSLALLTLVENAVKHGIAPNVEGGELIIRARSHHDFWALEVSNTVGPCKATLSGGTGLPNLRERVALCGGERARFEVYHGADYYRLRLEFPT